MNLSTRIINFLKEWTLPVAMSAGVIGYFLLADIPFLAPLKPLALDTARYLTPVLIFLMLFFTFLKINMKEMKPQRWHLRLLLLQTVLCSAMLLPILLRHSSSAEKMVMEGILACLLAPTATAAAVVTGKLGGNAASITSYTLESNLLSAVLITVFCPLVEPQSDVSMLATFTQVFTSVFQLLLMPFFVAWIIRFFFPRLHQFLLRPKNIAFYLWGFSLSIVMAQTMRILLHSDAHPFIAALIALGALVVCCGKFFLGKTIGGLSHERISGGQALGQKNTIFAIWMALTYLNPLSAVGPGSYVIWQNSINSWQIWKKRKHDAR